METIRYSDTADGLSRMSKEQFRATYLKLEKEERKWADRYFPSFLLGTGLMIPAIIPLAKVISEGPHTILAFVLAIGFLVVAFIGIMSMIFFISNREFRAKDDLEILKRAAPEEVRRIQAERSHFAYNTSKQRFLAESTDLASRLGI